MSPRFPHGFAIFSGFIGASTALLGACGGSVDSGSAAAATKPAIEVRVVDGQAPAQEQCGEPSSDWSADLCRAYRLIAVGATSVVDASGDGRVAPGEELLINTSVLNLSRCTMNTAPALALSSDQLGLHRIQGVQTMYTFPGNAAWPTTLDVVIPPGTAHGSDIQLEVAPDSGIESLGSECAGASKAIIDVHVD